MAFFFSLLVGTAGRWPGDRFVPVDLRFVYGLVCLVLLPDRLYSPGLVATAGVVPLRLPGVDSHLFGAGDVPDFGADGPFGLVDSSRAVFSLGLLDVFVLPGLFSFSGKKLLQQPHLPVHLAAAVAQRHRCRPFFFHCGKKFRIPHSAFRIWLFPAGNNLSCSCKS